jgi:hypothetical protein
MTVVAMIVAKPGGGTFMGGRAMAEPVGIYASERRIN